MKKKDHYATLGVPRGAGPDSVKRAFRRKVKKAHPDAGGTAEAFREVTLAYETLSDPACRSRYDATGDDTVPNQSAEFAEVAKLVSQAVDAMGDGDVFLACRLGIEQQVKASEGCKSSCLRSAAKHREAAKKVKRKGGGENLLAAVLEANAQNYERQAAMHQREADRARALLPILAEYEWLADQKNELAGMFFQHGDQVEFGGVRFTVKR